MSVSYSVQGFRPPDDQWLSMKKVWDACNVAGVSPPDEVLTFFDHEEPDPVGVLVDLDDSDAVEELAEEGSFSYQVTLSKLPAGLSCIRFTIDY